MGRRARAILEQQELANLDGHPQRVDGLRLAARKVIRVPSSEMQTVGIGVKGRSLHGAEPSRIPREERSGYWCGFRQLEGNLGTASRKQFLI